MDDEKEDDAADKVENPIAGLTKNLQQKLTTNLIHA